MLLIGSNAVHAQMFNATREQKMVASEALSYVVDGAQHTKAFKSTGWDGRSTFFNFRKGTFPAGFVSLVFAELKRAGHRCRLTRTPLPQPMGVDLPVVDDFGYTEEYSYQVEAAELGIRHGQMIAQVATGGGKSRIANIYAARIKRPTLFLTTRGVLMHQMRESFERGIKSRLAAGEVIEHQRIGVIGDSEFSPSGGINVGMVQTIARQTEIKTLSDEMEAHCKRVDKAIAKKVNAAEKKLIKANASKAKIEKIKKALVKKLNDEQPSDEAVAAKIHKRLRKHIKQRQLMIKLLERFEVLILEEAHETGSDSYFHIAGLCKNAHYRLSLTATPFMKEDQEANMNLMAVSGAVGIKISEKMLIDKGILARPVFQYIQSARPRGLAMGTRWPRSYNIGITENDYRNSEIIRQAQDAAEHGLTAMCLVLRKAHGEELERLGVEAGLRTRYIDGSSTQEERKGALAELECGEIDLLVGTNILDVGVDVPAVGMVILGGGGKEEVALRQRIGRGLRRKKTGPNICLVVDFFDRHNTTLREHSFIRRSIVEKTPGFAENILPTGVPFDYSPFNK